MKSFSCISLWITSHVYLTLFTKNPCMCSSTQSHNSQQQLNNKVTYRSKMIWAAELWHRSSGSGSLGRIQEAWEGRDLHTFWCLVVKEREKLGMELRGLIVWHYLNTPRRFGTQCWFWHQSDWSEQRCYWNWCCCCWRRSYWGWRKAFGFHVPDPCLPVAAVPVNHVCCHLHHRTRRGRVTADSASIWISRVCQRPCRPAAPYIHD